jgi:hypothetical protein
MRKSTDRSGAERKLGCRLKARPYNGLEEMAGVRVGRRLGEEMTGVWGRTLGEEMAGAGL